MKNILILSPHPDDESVGLAVTIRKMKREGFKVYIFFLTSGVIAQKDLWIWNRNKYKSFLKARINEMKESMNFLKINDYFFQDVPTRYLKSNIVQTIKKIKEIIIKKKIDTLFVPAYEGGHQDHDIANFIGFNFKHELNVYEFAEYNNSSNQLISNNFIRKTGNEIIYKLNQEEVNYKNIALSIYVSEVKNLSYIKTNQESYRPIVNYDYSKPPHCGVLFYRRYSFFSWHPRVDSTNPDEISRIIVSYGERNEF